MTRNPDSPVAGTRPSRGEIWEANLNPVRGHEQGGERPCLVVSTNPFNYGRAELVVLVPLTTRQRNLPLYVPIRPPEGGLRYLSFIMCDQVKTYALERLTRRLGQVSPPTLTDVETRLRWLMEL